MRRNSPLSTLAVLLFPLLTVFVLPGLQDFLIRLSSMNYTLTGFWITRLTWVILGILIVGLCYSVYKDTGQTVRIITAVWAVILLVLIAGSFFGFTQWFFMIRGSIIGSYSTSLMEMTIGLYVALLFLGNANRR